MTAQPLRVLVVDDNIDFALSFAELLHTMGCVVAVASDAHSAVMKAGPERPHVVFLDLHLGTENGSDVMSALRRMLHDDDGLTIVCLTGYGFSSTELQVRKAGFDLYLTKPVSPELLQEVLAACEIRVEAARRAAWAGAAPVAQGSAGASRA